MDPQSQPPAKFEAPASRPPGDMIPLVAANQEASPGVPEMAQNPASQAPSMSLPPQPTGPMPAAQAIPGLSAAPTSSAPVSMHPAAPAIADDLDLIEKEWVDKAKAIVAQTRNDPYAQNKEINTFKADYMKKRYNKDIKIEP